MAVDNRVEDRLRRAYELLSDIFEKPAAEDESGAPPWYAPPLPPIAAGTRLSATDLLSCWFRPPTGRRGGWDWYFGDNTPAPGMKKPAGGQDRDQVAEPAASATGKAVEAAQQALLPDPDDDLSSEDADQAVDVFYEFIHAFGRRDIERAMEFVADDYHIVEHDREVDRNELRCRLESLLESFHGWDIEVSLASPPQPLSHPYGILIYSEIQIDAMKPDSDSRRSLLERRVALMEHDRKSGFKIAALGQPRL